MSYMDRKQKFIGEMSMSVSIVFVCVYTLNIFEKLAVSEIAS